VKPITFAKFVQIAGAEYRGIPALHRELGWYASEDESRIGAIVLDLVDNDYGWVLLTADAPDAVPGRFACADVATSLPSAEAACSALEQALTAPDGGSSSSIHEGTSASWLDNGPYPDWLAEESDRRYATLAEAWQEVDAITRQVSPRMEEQQRRALLQVFHVGADEALAVFPASRDGDHFAELMAERWLVFADYAVLPFMRLRPEAALAPPDVVQREVAGLIEHQHGYFEVGGRAALLCLRSGASLAALAGEIRAAAQMAVRRHRH
jgi:hypothetical protein